MKTTLSTRQSGISQVATKRLGSLQRSKRLQRRGAAAIMIAAMMFVFVVTTAITVDYAYMQLVRTELRSASDAAAKAGAEALSRTQDVDFAKSEAVRYASMNSVGNQPFKLSPNDVTIGRVSSTGSGRWAFKANGSPANAVRIDARTGTGALQPAVPLFFSSALGKSGFTPSYQSTAGQQEVEVCLCLDRSGSMTFDMTGEEWSWAPNNPLLSTITAFGSDWRNLLSPPHPTKSRWAAMRGAIDVFFQQAANYNPPPRTSLVTWGSDYVMPVAPSTVFSDASVDFDLPSSGGFNWAKNVSSITGSVVARGQLPMMGGTNLSAGLDLAVTVLNGKNGNALSSKVVILLTDGEWNAGRDPTLSAYDARSKGIIVHCVSMLTKNQADLQKVADITGGRYYGTSNEAELRAAFDDIAKSLPIVLTD